MGVLNNYIDLLKLKKKVVDLDQEDAQLSIELGNVETLIGETDVSDIADGTLTGIASELNENLIYKKVAEITINTTSTAYTIPNVSKYNEFIFDFRYNASTRGTLNVPKERLYMKQDMYCNTSLGACYVKLNNDTSIQSMGATNINVLVIYAK